jgi:3-methyladenine DNA glycosylase AlkD
MASSSWIEAAPAIGTFVLHDQTMRTWRSCDIGINAYVELQLRPSLAASWTAADREVTASLWKIDRT